MSFSEDKRRLFENKHNPQKVVRTAFNMIEHMADTEKYKQLLFALQQAGNHMFNLNNKFQMLIAKVVRIN